MTTPLISPAYLNEQMRLHADPRGYGARGRKWSEWVVTIGVRYGCASVLDYGCGRGSLVAEIAPRGVFADLHEYDPAIPGKDALPAPADLVVCTDVLEHVESECVWAVVRHLASLTRKACFVVVSLIETSKQLSDGRQAHITLRSATWWAEAMAAHGLVVAREISVKPEKQWCAVLVRRPA